MEQNKLKLEDCCLTIEQAKELQALGINMDNCLMEFCSLKDFGDYHLLPKHKYENNFIRWKYIPTLTNAEMLEMLPKNPFSLDGYKLKITKERNGDYTVGYFKECNGKSETFYATAATKLRGALYDIIRVLKINKLM